MTFKTLFYSSLAIFFIWWGVYAQTRLGFAGVSIADTANQDTPVQLDHYKQSATGAAFISEGFRPIASWVVLGVYHLLVMPTIFIASQHHFLNTEYPIAVATALVAFLVCLAAFGLIATQYPNPFGMLFLIGVGLLPLAASVYGLNHSDPLILLFWAVVVYGLDKAMVISEERWAPYAAVLAGVLGTWVSGYGGIALVLTLEVLRGFQSQRKRFYRKLALWVLGGTLVAGFIGYRVMPQQSMGELKGGDWVLSSFYWMDRILLIGLIVSTLTAWLNRRRSPAEDQQRNHRMAVCCAAAAAGFLGTLPFQMATTDLSQEWPRQLLPLAYLVLGFSIGGGAYAGAQMRAR